jgi:hypothetical protein
VQYHSLAEQITTPLEKNSDKTSSNSGPIMKAAVKKAWSFITFNNILSVVFTAYLANALNSLYQMAVVPVVLPDSGKSSQLLSHVAPNQHFDMHMYISPEARFNESRSHYIGAFRDAVYSTEFSEDQIQSSTGDRGKIELRDFKLPLDICKRNTTLFLHTFVTSASDTLNYRQYPLSQQLIPMEERDSKHYLLDSSYDPSHVTSIQSPYTSIPSRIEVGVILETRPMNRTEMLRRGFGRYIDNRVGKLVLPIHVNPFITPRDEYVSLLECPTIPSFEVIYKPIGMSYWMLSDTLIRSFDNLENNMKMNEYDIDSFKMLITGSSTLKLAIVYSVSILHFIFEYLSIKSDLSFWKNRTNFNGISESSISMNVGMGVISALYVIEQDESRIALYFILIKMVMNLWKIWKMRSVSKDGEENALSSVAKEDRMYMWYLMVALVPLVMIFCVYRLIYYKYRSWYSWFILSLTAASEVFGFVTMTPQIFLNHRLKSVEHLPWTALTYSFINTFIDDLFAFGIFRVPEVSRYSCLRDDIVFVVICIQRWLYKDRRIEDDVVETIKPISQNVKAEVEMIDTQAEIKNQSVRARKPATDGDKSASDDGKKTTRKVTRGKVD